MPDLKQALKDFVATSNSGKYTDEQALLSKFPELKGYNINVLKDFVATSNSGNYQTEDELFAKFPEFRAGATVPAEELKKKEPAQMADMASVSEDASLDLQKPKKKVGILAQPVPQNTTESFLATVSAEPSIQPTKVKPKVVDQTPKEQDYFTGDFGKALKAIDEYSPIAIGDYVDDMGRAIASGYEAGKVVTPANELMIRDKKATAEQIKKYVQAAKEMEGLGPSQEMIDFTKTYEDEGKGVWGLIKGLAFNPTVVPQVMVNSITMMLNPTSLATIGGVVGGSAAVGAALSPYVAGAGAAPAAIGSIPYAFGAASATLESGLTFSELLKEELDKKGLDFNEANVKKILEDDKLVSSIRGRSIARGAAIGTVDALTGRLAGKVGAKLLTGTAASRVKAGLAAAAIESVGGAAGESTGRLVAGQEQDVAEIGLEGIAEGPMAIPSLAAEVLNKPVYKIDGKRVSEIDVKEIVENTPAPDLAKINFEFKNDRSKWANKIQDKVVTHSTKEQVREANPELNEPSLDAITKLELDLQKLQGNTTQTGKDKAAALRGQIKGIQENQLQAEATQQNVLGSAYRSQRISDAQKALAQPENKEGTVTIDDKTVPRTELEKELQTLKAEQNAIQEQTAGQVPVQSEAGTRLQVAEGEPQAEPQGVTQEVKAEEVTDEKSQEIGTQVGNLVGIFNDATALDEGTERERNAKKIKSNKAYKKLDKFFGYSFGDRSSDDKIAKQSALNALATMLNQDRSTGYLAEDNRSYKFADTNELMTAYKEDKANGVASPVVKSIDTLLGITPAVTPQVATQENQAQIETLRAQEQTELLEAIPNATQYVVDGKVDRTKITDANELKAFDEIYDKYDKLITPLLETTEVSSKTQAPKFVRDITALITPATVRQFDNLTKRIKKLSLNYDKLVKEYAKTKDSKTLAKIKETENQILNDAKQEIIDAVAKIKGVSVKFQDAKRGLWDGKFEPSFNMTLSISPQADTKKVSDLLFDFSEKYSQDAFILETDSELQNEWVNGNIDMPLTEIDGNELMNYPQIIYTFAEPIIDEQVADLSLALQKEGIDAFSINNNGLQVSVMTFLPEDNNLTKEEQYNEKLKDFQSKSNATANAVGQTLGSNALDAGDVVIKKSSYNGAINEGTKDQTRQFDRSDVLEAFKESTAKVAPATEKAPVEEVAVEEEEEQFVPLTLKDIDNDPFTKDNSSDYEEDEREGDNGRSYIYLSSITVPITNQDGDTIGGLVKMSDGDGELTFDAEDDMGNRISKNDEGFLTLGDAKRAFLEAYNKEQKKEFDREAKKKAKEKAKQAEKAATKAAKAAAKEGTAKVEAVQAVVDELLALDPNDKGTAQKISDSIGKAIKDIEKFEKTSLGVNVALPIIKGILKAVKTLIDAGISLQQALKQVAKDNNITEQQVKDNINIVPILDGFNEVMTKVEALITRQKSKKVAEAKIVSNVDAFIRNSEVYKAANDAQKKILEKEGRAKMGVDERRAPSIGRVLGALKDFTNISRQEKIKIIKQIRTLTQDASKSLIKEINEMRTVGKITVNQATNILSRFSKVNMLSEVSVGNFVDYMSRVFNNAEYAQKIDVVKKQLSTAKKNIAKKIGIADGLIIPLQKLFAINPNLIPDSVFDEYVALVDMFGKRESVLSLDDKSSVTRQVQAILDAVNAEQSELIDLASRLEDFKNTVYNEDGSIDYAATLKKMIDDEVINEDEAEIMRKYKSDILPQAETKKKTDEEIKAEKDELINYAFNDTAPTDNLPSRDERELAKKLLSLKQTTAILDLSVSELKNLIKVIDNIRNGYLPSYANQMVKRLESINSSKPLESAIVTANPLSLTEAYAKVKSLFTGRSAVLEMIRRNPLANIDQIFGNFKTKEVFNSILNKPSEAAAAFQTELKKVQNILEKAEAKVAQSFKLDPNETLMSKFKMMTYLIQLEYQANPGNKQVNQAADFLKATIKHIEAGKSRFGERDATMLSEILDKYAVNKGEIDVNKLYNSFNDAEKSAIKDIQDVNKSLTGKAEYTASVIRGEKFNPLNSYVHLNVLNESQPTDLTSSVSFAEQYNNSMRPSTKAKSLIERTGKVSPLNFDVFASAQRGAKFVLLDYNLTNPITTSRMTLNQTEANLQKKADQQARAEAKKNGITDKEQLNKITGKISKQDREVFNAIRDAFEEATENLLNNSVVSNSLTDDVIDYINKQGYRAILAGSGRFVSELTSNIGFALIVDPKAFMTGIDNRGFIMSADAPLVMQNVKSKQTSRIFPTDTLSGRAIDTSILKQANGIVGGKAKNIVANKIQQIWNLSGKKYTNTVELTADALISTPDKVVMRPMWFGSFANTFKTITGQDVNFEKIAANDEAYMNQYQDAINKAKTIADERSVMTGATDNPFMGLLKGTVKPNQTLTRRAFNNFNSFMTKFLIFEYVTARTGIMAAMGNGSLTKKQGAAVLAGVTTRMVVYSLLGQMLGNGLMGMFYDDDEPEDDKSFFQKAGQAIASAFTSLVLGRDFGNATKTIVNAGIESMNEEYLDFLREGEYDPYKDAIQFSVIPKERKGKQNDLGDLLMNMGGAFGPSFKTANFIYVKMTEDDKKKADAIERQEKERNIRIPLEILGNAGFIPLYKDVRKLVMKNIYSSLINAEQNLSDKKRVEAEKLQGFETEGDMKRYDSQMWDRTYGPSSEGYDEREAARKIKLEAQRMKRALKDEEYNYTPKADKDGFGSKKGFSESKPKSRSRSKSDGFGSKKGFN